MKIKLSPRKKSQIVNLWKNWAKTLKSGKYQKGVGNLKKKTSHGIKYCCLGVLSENCKLENRPNFIGSKEFEFIYKDEKNELVLPKSFAEESGISKNGELSDLGKSAFLNMFGYRRNGPESLATINDSTNLTFKDIGNFINAAANHLNKTGESYFLPYNPED